jgi:hypothetical protein
LVEIIFFYSLQNNRCIKIFGRVNNLWIFLSNNARKKLLIHCKRERERRGRERERERFQLILLKV